MNLTNEITPVENYEPQGIGGWLLVFVIYYFLQMPITLASLFMTANNNNKFSISMLTLAVSNAILIVFFLFKLLIKKINLDYVGYYLFFTLCFPYILNPILNSRYSSLILIPFVLSLMFYFIWFVYFKESLRVENTFIQKAAS